MNENYYQMMRRKEREAAIYLAYSKSNDNRSAPQMMADILFGKKKDDGNNS
jgi:hypothetical protein